MDPLWTSVDPLWILSGPSVEFCGTLCGSFVGPLWTLCGSYVDPMWILGGASVDPLWTLCGPLWPSVDLCGPHVDPLWGLCGPSVGLCGLLQTRGTPKQNRVFIPWQASFVCSVDLCGDL